MPDCERIILDDTTPEGLRKLARIERAIGRLGTTTDNAALRSALEAVDISDAPMDLQGYKGLWLGMACHQLQDYGCAASQLDVAMVGGHLRFDLLSYFVDAIFRSGSADRAMELFDDRLGSNPPEERFHQSLLLVQALLLERLGPSRDQDRIAKLRSLAQLDIKVDRVANQVCWNLVTDHGDAKSAQSACNAAVRLAPADAANLDSRAVMHFTLGDYFSAIADFERALQAPNSEPIQADIKYGLSLALQKRGGEGDAARAEQLRVEAVALKPEIAETFAAYKIYAFAGSGT